MHKIKPNIGNKVGSFNSFTISDEINEQYF